MNPETGHITRLDDKDVQELRQLKEEGYEEVPKHLRYAAQQKLKGKKQATVSLTSGGKLSKWAAERRKEKRKKRNQMAKQSRKANRNS